MIEVVTQYVNLNTQNKIYFSHNIVCVCFIIINLKVIVKKFSQFSRKLQMETFKNKFYKVSSVFNLRYNYIHLYGFIKLLKPPLLPQKVISKQQQKKTSSLYKSIALSRRSKTKI